jgi:hypothetical protein
MRSLTVALAAVSSWGQLHHERATAQLRIIMLLTFKVALRSGSSRCGYQHTDSLCVVAKPTGH